MTKKKQSILNFWSPRGALETCVRKPQILSAGTRLLIVENVQHQEKVKREQVIESSHRGSTRNQLYLGRVEIRNEAVRRRVIEASSLCDDLVGRSRVSRSDFEKFSTSALPLTTNIKPRPGSSLAQWGHRHSCLTWGAQPAVLIAF